MSTLRSILLGTKRRRAVTLLGMLVVMGLLAIEVACQIVAYIQFRELDKWRVHPDNFVQASTAPGVTYELLHNYDKTTDGRRVKINALGFREETDDLFADKRRVAIFGDSVALGIGATQDQTIPVELQRLVDPAVERVKFLNCGLLGLGMSEFPAYLRHVFSVYKPNQVVFLMNPNDFVLRDTMYEGADGGMYRMFERPLLKTPVVVHKAIYRMKKGGISPSLGWYRWTYQGTKAENLPKFKELKAICDQAGAGFHIVLLPVRGSFNRDDDAIISMYKEIGDYLTAAGIAWSYPDRVFADAGATPDPAGCKLIDHTDHYTPEGTKLMARACVPIVTPPEPAK